MAHRGRQGPAKYTLFVVLLSDEQQTAWLGLLDLVHRMQGSAKYGVFVLSFSDEQENDYQTAWLGLLDLVHRMQGSVKYGVFVASFSDEQERRTEVYSLSLSLAQDTSLARYLRW